MIENTVAHVRIELRDHVATGYIVEMMENKLPDSTIFDTAGQSPPTNERTQRLAASGSLGFPSHLVGIRLTARRARFSSWEIRRRGRKRSDRARQ